MAVAIRHIKWAATAVGLEQPARTVLNTWRRRRSRVFDRTWKDFERLRLLLAFAVPADANCIDVGAANGKVLAEIVRYSPRGRHIAYEPLPVFHSDLAARFPSVDVRAVALSDADGETTFTYVTERPWVSGFRRGHHSVDARIASISVRTERLDDHLPEGYVPHLIKIDVEGAEELVFRGALRTIAQHKPIVVFQHGRGSAEAYGTRPGTIYRLLTGDAGLRIFDMDGGGPYTAAEFEKAYDTNSHFHFVARP